MNRALQIADDISIVFLGDSITDGQHVGVGHRWTDLTAQALKDMYESKGINIIAFNKGISGETSRQGLMRYVQDVQNIAPDILTIQFGLNDCNRWVTDKGYNRVSKDSFKANLKEMIERAWLFDTKHIILSNNNKTLRNQLLPGGKSLEDERKVYNYIIKEIALETGVIFCDMESWFNQIKELEYPQYLLPDPDLLHLSKLGHQHYMKKIFSVIHSSIEGIIKKQLE